MQVKQLLQEMSGAVKQLYHYTNPKALYYILKERRLRTQLYPTGTHHDRKTERRRELATIRPSRASTVSVANLSGSIGKVKIIIQFDKLNDLVRGTRALPIAEFPISRMRDLGTDVMNHIGIRDEDLAEKIAIKLVRLFRTEGSDFFKSGSLTTAAYNKLVSSLKKKILEITGVNNIKNTEGFVRNLIKHINELNDDAKKREGEERIVLKQGEGIPLDKRYIKIELLQDFTDDFVALMRFYDSAQKLDNGYILEFEELAKSNEDLFIHNDEYNRFIKSFDVVKKYIKRPVSDKKKDLALWRHKNIEGVIGR